MTPARRRNVERLLDPRHIAVIGGREAETVAGECARIGYRGTVWPVNPRRTTLAGRPCFAQVEDLPQAPDAAFVAVPREAAIDTVARLAAMGAGGAVCHTAGFAETGERGAALETALVEAAGDLALVGPNCYGIVNYLDRAALWPFAHGGGCPGYGAAIVTQSGMLSSDLTMSQRSVPFAVMASIGNQSVLTLADFVDVLAGRPGVRAIGLHIEEIPDVAHFEEAAGKALAADVPVVALKTGVSEIGSRLTASHTGALSGADSLYQALFDRLGVIRVTTPAQLLETLKLLCVTGAPAGERIAGFTCSGGAAAMLADGAEGLGLKFPRPTPEVARRLAEHLPHTATVSNPLDYTTPIWGLPERVGPVFDAMLADTCDIALIVQDYPLEGLDESKPSYLADAAAFIAATRAAGVPAAVCSTLPENIDLATREMLIENGVAPMQGIREALEAVAGAAWYRRRRARIIAGDSAGGGDSYLARDPVPAHHARDDDGMRATVTTRPAPGTTPDPARGSAPSATQVPARGAADGSRDGASAAQHPCHRASRRHSAPQLRPDPKPVSSGSVTMLDEHRAKTWLHAAGVPIPAGIATGAEAAPEAAAAVGFPVAVKMLSDRLPHKTDAGAVALGLAGRTQVEAAVARIRASVRGHDEEALSDRFLVEKMVEPPLAELLVNVRAEPRFGFAMTLASGGMLTELVADAVTVLLPASRADLGEALGRLRLSRLLDGYRGASAADRTMIVDALVRLADHFCRPGCEAVEVEINPLFVLPHRVCAVDAAMWVARG